MKKVLITMVLFLVAHQLIAQNYKFGKVSKEELQEKFYPQDSSANAVILYKKRRTYFDYREEQGWILKTIINERIKIYNKEGYSWATKKVNLYKDGDDERMSVKAYTFNLVDNKIQKIKLKKNEIFQENINKYWRRKKFTMPNLKEGSIVEWEYTIQSPYYWRIDDVIFQEKIPIKYIDFKVEIPEYFIFNNQMQGYFPIKLDRITQSSSIRINTKTKEGSYQKGIKTKFNEYKINLNINVISGKQENIPSIKEESYVSNINNYKTVLKFELTSTKFPNSPMNVYSRTWDDVTKTINNSANFGEQIKKIAHFKKDLANLVTNSSTAAEKIVKILQFVKNKIKWNGYKSKYTRQGVKKAYKEGVGNSAEVNLTLVSMLREAGIHANPILVSTRDNGIPLFPTSDGFNYVIAAIEVENAVILLDATEAYSTPNVLPLRDLNWQGRLVRESGSSTWVNLTPTKSAEEKALISIVIDEDGVVEGMNRIKYTDLYALKYRNKYSKIKEENVISKVEELKDGIEIADFRINNKKNIYKPIVEMYKFSSEDLTEVIGTKIYFKPLFFEAITENPFGLDRREYPIDFGTSFVEKKAISITIPEGYSIESVPENLAVALPNNYGTYKFIISALGNKINILSNLQINTAVYPATNYSQIKEFYKLIVNKNSEQIVLKKSNI